ncbi:ribosome recycling factor [Fomitiporia mediterranea MF3/22]|uniref:ribosome recycling factor n=1 Tax=Fomitiporia mediterranea (strain MF3/22) TaxID=694068 RepID=UPI0004408355|nr:ribosome recycling factor [Fomitiporia mediterranea MF3/22]EJD05406.1 ribosome recycling factor [Fomitiporia mediterranea MF3/22]
MKSAIDWFRREVASKEIQGSGRVTPDILKPVRVSLPGMPEGETSGLTELATVGVREGTTLIVTVFAEDTLKHVEKAIYAARIPHVVPQRMDNRTIKIPMPKPTVEARAELVKSATKLAEDTRVQLRRVEQTSVKKGNYKKHSIAIDEFHELLQRHLKEADSILADMKKNLGVK